MAREDVTTAVGNAVASDRVAAAAFVKLDYASGTVRAWSGVGGISWDSQTWSGVGELGSISAMTEQTGVVATGATVGLSGVDATLLGKALDENYQGRDARIWLAFFDTDDLSLLDDPVLLFGGVMDTSDVDRQGGSGSITVNMESYLRVLERSRNRRRTHQDQQLRFSGDKGLEYVAAIQDVPINWGQADAQQTKQSRKTLRRRGR
jgi:hypothetical protein